MHEPPREPWNPDRSWADPLITLLALLALLAAGFTLSARKEAFRRPSVRVSLQGRLTEVALMGQVLLPGHGIKTSDWTKVESQLTEPWDRAMLAVLKAEQPDQNEDARAWIDRVTPVGSGGWPSVASASPLTLMGLHPVGPTERKSADAWGRVTPPICSRPASWIAKARKMASAPRLERI